MDENIKNHKNKPEKLKTTESAENAKEKIWEPQYSN